MTSMSNVTIYSTPSCHLCHAAKDMFKANNIEFTDYNVATDLPHRQEMIQKSGQMGVPVILVDNELVVGFDEERLRELMGQTGIRVPYSIVEGVVPLAVRDEAERLGADLIITGRGVAQGAFSRMWSHLYPIIRHSPCPVLSI